MKLDKSLDKLDEFVDTLISEIKSNECETVLRSKNLVYETLQLIHALGKKMCEMMNCDDTGCAGKHFATCLQKADIAMYIVINEVSNKIYLCEEGRRHG